MLLVIFFLKKASSFCFIHGFLHGTGYGVGIHYGVSFNMAGGTTHSLNKGSFGTQETFFVSVHNGDE